MSALKPTVPYEGGRATSREAAQAKREDVERLRADEKRVYDAILDSQREGITDDAIEHKLGMRHTTVSARRRALYLQGLVVWCGQTRKTSSGRQANVWHTWGCANAYRLPVVQLPRTREETLIPLLDVCRELAAMSKSGNLKDVGTKLIEMEFRLKEYEQC